MKKSFSFSDILILLFSLFSISKAGALTLSDINSKFGDIFDSFSDDNAGSTIFRSLNIPSGGRAESLGTAVTGLCDDITFFDYNPAGSSVLDQSEAALFHNAWIADSAQETLEGTFRVNNFGMGLQFKCFYVPFTEYNLFGDKVAGNYYSETSFTLNMSYNFFAGYDFKGIALGYNIRGTWRSMPDYTDDRTDEIISGSGFSQSALGIMGDGGILLRFNFLKHFNDVEPNLCFGLTLNNVGIAFTGFNSDFQFDDPLPTRAAFGFSYRMMKSLLITGEFRQPVNLFDIPSSEKFSLASGLEINVTKFFDFETGFLISGANPRFSLGSQFLIAGVKMNINYTLDLTSSFNPVNHISLAARLLLGDRGRGTVKAEVQKKYAEGINLYSKGTREDIVAAIIKWNEAKDLSKTIGIKYDPAIQAIKTAQSLLDVHDQINAFGTLDR
jgi:hypothetical protein